MPKNSVKLIPGAFAAAVLLAAAGVGIGQSPGVSTAHPSGLDDVSGYLSTPVPARPQLGAAGDMIGFSGSDASGSQTITLVHTGKSWMAVYHIDKSGKIRLVSSRPIDADFSLQLNATSPLPEEIRQIGRR